MLSAALALILFLVIIPGARKKKARQAAPEGETVAVVSETPSETDASQAVQTPLPTEEQRTRAPAVVGEQMCSILLTASVSASDAEGEGEKYPVTGSCAVRFVNNTDSVLYSADFAVSGLQVFKASVGGVPARFSVSNEGVLTIPFFSELQRDEALEVYFEFGSDGGAGVFSIPRPAYGGRFVLTAFISSRNALSFFGAEAEQKMEMHGWSYSIIKQTVTRPSASVVQ